jgi:hypothetical protein
LFAADHALEVEVRRHFDGHERSARAARISHASFAMTEDRAGVGEATRKIGEGLTELARALSAQRAELAEPVSKFLSDRPLASLGIAFGVGYVLAGGLWSRVTSRMIGVAWRLGGVALARDFLQGLAAEAGDRF